MKRLAIWMASGFGLGYSPVASGTTGSLPGVALAWIINSCLPWTWQIPIALALAALAVPLCDVAEKHYGKKDDGRIVADEWMLFPLCVIGLPAHPLMFVVAFVVARLFDILKLWPAHGLQRLTGGLGIVIDDFFAMLYALALNHAAFLALRHLALV
jgi:phosphatidylglycerophosphatase A